MYECVCIYAYVYALYLIKVRVEVAPASSVQSAQLARGVAVVHLCAPVEPTHYAGQHEKEGDLNGDYNHTAQ
jgi:hypothetical protein